MKMKRFLTIAALALGALPVAADDFGLWTEAVVQKSFSKQFSVDGGIEYRTEDNMSHPTRWAFSLGTSYKPAKFLSLSAGYVFLRAYNGEECEADYKKSNGAFNGYNVDHAYWRNKHRAVFDVTGKVDVGRFTFSLRERYQYTHYMEATTTRDKYRDELEPAMVPGWTGDLYPCNGMYFTEFTQESDRVKKAKDKHYLRSRLQVEYNIRHCAWTPYAAYEVSNNLGESMHLDKKRLQVGAEWKITKQHRLDFAYLYENGADDDDRDNQHIISVGYKFKF